MKIKLDENLPGALAVLLRSANHDVTTVSDERLSVATDTSILQGATAEERLVMTFDTDGALLTIMELAAGKITEEQLAEWISNNSEKTQAGP